MAPSNEMQERVDAFDWSRTPLGAIESWSPALRMMVQFLLSNRFPLLLWWGPQYVCIYNDAYSSVLGAKHPWALGRPVKDVWSEVWEVIQPLIDTPFKGGPATWNEDICLELNRRNFLEEAHFTIAYSPVPDEAVESGIGGVIATVHEITEKVVGDRRVATLRDLGVRSIDAKTSEEACAIAAESLVGHAKDIPFALLYLMDANQQTARLAGSVGVMTGSRAAPVKITFHAEENCDAVWPFDAAMKSGSVEIVPNLSTRLAGEIPPGPWRDPPHTAVVMPILSNKLHHVAGFLIAGVSARLQFDQSYLDFLGLATNQIAGSIANAREIEQEKKRAEALAEIDRAKTVFFSNVSHEFRTPLALTLGPIEEVLERSRTELPLSVRDGLQMAHRNGQRLLRLVNNLLDFSRIEAGRARALFLPTDLADYTKELANVFRAAIERAGLRLDVDCPPLSEPVYVDRDMWEKVVLNLVSNAFKFTFEGKITISLHVADSLVELRVRDSGVGIPDEEMPRLFERFHRVPNTRSRTHEGSGIGLALVWELVKLHGGSLRAESRLGEGSTFIVSLPLGKAHLPQEQIGVADIHTRTSSGVEPFVEEALLWLPDHLSEGEAKPELNENKSPSDHRKDLALKHPLVLVVDDNADMRKYLARLLAERCEVLLAPDGLAALALARERRPDLILSDVMMPIMDGVELLRALRSDAVLHTIPVIFLSARAGEDSRIEGLQEGADDYIIKPFTARELLARVSAHLDLTRLRSEEQEREKQNALRESEKRFRALVEASSEAVYRMSGDWTEMRYLHSDDFIADTQEPITDWLQKYIPSEEKTRVLAVIKHAIQTKTIFELEHQVLRADGSLGWTYSRAVPIVDKSGEIIEWFGVASDITSRKEAEKGLREADHRKDEFLAMLAHELRNPLAAIYSATQVIKLKNEDRERLLSVIERQTNHLIRLVDDLLEISRINRGTIELRKEMIDLVCVAHDAIEACRSLIEQKCHRVSLIVSDEPIWVMGDPVRLVQISINLLNNSIKYTPTGGVIAIEVTHDNSKAFLRIRDNGIGIPVEILPHVFELFMRVDNKGNSDSGLGIGLWLAQKIAALHGGCLEARSEGVGHGAEFSVTLPLAKNPQPNSQEIAVDPLRAEKAAKDTTKLRVLVVDDEHELGDVFGSLLESLGALVRVARDGPSGIEIFDEFEPDIIFLDIGMAGMDGYETARRIRAKNHGHPFILVALTGWGQERDRLLAREAGFDEHLTKPASIDSVKELLDRIQTNRKP